MSIDRDKLKAEIIARRGYWHPFHEGLLELNPEFLNAYLQFQDGPARSGHLAPTVREFIYIAIDGAVSHLYERGLRRHIEDALRLGATKEEVLQVILLATAAEGQIPNAAGHRILMEESKSAAPRLTAEQQRRKDAYVAAAGAWPEGGDAILALSPQFAEGFLGYGEVAWSAGPLAPKIKAFIGLAVCASPSLLYEPGMRRHIRLALDHGATKEEISEVLQLASAIAIHTCTYAVPALVEAVKAVTEPSSS
jgi:alkylhydroperoxidase/carboxymuconolactone decarboxylase family protein YurZ